MNRNRHHDGVPGQINVYVLDVESDITTFGNHNRLLVFHNSESNQVEIREDEIGLPSSAEEDRLGCQPDIPTYAPEKYQIDSPAKQARYRQP